MPIARLGIHCSDLPAIIWRCGAGLVEDGGDEFEFEEVAAALTPSMDRVRHAALGDAATGDPDRRRQGPHPGRQNTMS